ncbi:zf-HC2 domain-containing protein [bacterium]|nr:zf-HC2 domain-containing protein [bacterium]
MDCKICRENIHDFIKDNLSRKETGQMNAHLDFCAECHREVAQERNLSSMMNQWEVPKTGKGFDLRLDERLAQERNRPHSWFRRLFSVN